MDMNLVSFYYSCTRQTRVLGVVAICLIFVLFIKNMGILSPNTSHARPVEHTDVSTSHTTTINQFYSKHQVDWSLALARDPFCLTPVSGADSDTVDLPAPDIQDQIDKKQVSEDAIRLLDIQGLILGETRRVMINSHVYTVGESVNGYRILDIQHDMIIVEFDGIKVSLTN